MKLLDQMRNIFFRIFKIICNFGNCFSFFKFFLNERADFLEKFFSFLFSSRNNIPVPFPLPKHDAFCSHWVSSFPSMRCVGEHERGQNGE